MINESGYFGHGCDDSLIDEELGSDDFDEVFILFGVTTEDHFCDCLNE